MSGAVNAGSGNAQAFLASVDFQADLIKLLPPGNAWIGSNMALLLAGIADAFADLHAFLAQITEIETVPVSADQLLPEWEGDFGLPDCCTTLGATIAQRQISLSAKYQATGGQSASYFIGLAASLGFAVTITKFDTPRCGGRVGGRAYSPAWRFVWQMNVPGTSAAAAELVCRVSGYQPAIGKVLFAFTG